MNSTLYKVWGLICALACCLSCDHPEDPIATVLSADGAKDAPGPVPPEDLVATTKNERPPRPIPDFSRDIAPLIDKYCLRCHDSVEAPGGSALRFSGDGIADPRQRSLMLRVAERLRSESMPPEGEPRPDAEEFDRLNLWLDGAFVAEFGGPARVLLRRLNCAEYNNTIRDLIGLDLRPADEFPSDDIGYGFDNIGNVLSTPPILLEMYLAAADRVIDAAFRDARVRERLMSPVVDTVPIAFRNYRPPVRTPREGKIFKNPTSAHDPELARQQRIYDILRAFADRAFRRPATHEEITRLLGVVIAAEHDGEDAVSSIRLALGVVLASPQFLFLGIMPDHVARATGDHYLDGDFDVASRLSYFLWSTMPDKELDRLAARRELRQPGTLRAQVKRMLRDRKACALEENFASQWLEIRKLKDFTPDPRQFPAFDDDLKRAMVEETVRFFGSVRDEDRRILDLLDADYTFLNDRLARHYGIADVDGDQFRRVSLVGTPRGGLLTQASVLAVTSNPNRTSPVKRGKWILDNILGEPPAPPPSGVEALAESQAYRESTTVRERMSRHRADPACASCHDRMDSLGFGLENFDAIGAWRSDEACQPIDSTGRLPGGAVFQGPVQLKAAIVARRDAFARCLAEKLMTYALGRGLDRADRRHVDEIVARVVRQDYRFSALVLAVVESGPFLDRRFPIQRGGQ